MELCYVHYNKQDGNGSRYFYFVPIGERDGRIAGVYSSGLSDAEAMLLKRDAAKIDAMGPRERYEYLSLILPSFKSSYREIYPKYIVEAFTYKVE